MESDIELHPELIDIEWLKKSWADIEIFPREIFDRLHGARLFTPFDSAIYDDLGFLVEIARLRVFGG